MNKTKGLILSIFFMLIFCITTIGFSEEGVTDTEIHIGQSGPQTGPAAPWGIVSKGSAFYFDMINAEGGVHGRKIVHHDFDDGYNPANTKYGVKHLQETIGMFCWLGIVGAETGLAVKDYFIKKEIPWVGPTDGSLLWTIPPTRTIFNIYVPFHYESSLLCRYAVNILGKKRIAIIYQNANYGTTGLKGAVEEMERLGIPLIAQIPVDKGQTSMQNYALMLKKAEAEVVLIWMTPFEAVHLLKSAQDMKYFPQWMASSSFSDFDFMYKASRGLWENMIASTYGEFTDTPLMIKYKEAYKKLTGKDSWGGGFFHAGIGWAEILIEGLKRTGRDLTREKFIKAMEGIRNFKGAMGYINYFPFDPNNPSCREGQNELFIVQCLKDGKIKIISDWVKPGGKIILLK
ncbi:MAG: ABC transporter substrate-binding protein [Desulfobacterales bacterium]|nr:ABC transporter substrate-binding protein [Desulfobacterales bacterium]